MEFLAWFHFCRWLKRTIFVFFAKWKWVSCNDLHMKGLHMKGLQMKGLTPKEIKAELDNVYSTSTPAFAIVQLDKHNWNLNVVVYPHVMHFVREVQLRLSEIIDKVHDIVLTDRRVKVRELIKTTSTEISILHEQLSMKKIYRQDGCRVCSLWTSLMISKQCLEMFQSRWISASIHYCGRNMDPLFHTRRRNSQNNGTSSDELAPKKTKTIKPRKGNAPQFFGMHAA